MEKAIKKAIEGGYKWHGRDFSVEYKGANDKYQNNRHIFIEGEGYILDDHWLNSFLLDPAFWVALGKAMGWREYNPKLYPTDDKFYAGSWCDKWHRFIDHLADGKDADSFFEQLLNK